MANADHPKLAVLKRLTALIETVLPASGYDNNLAGKVYRGRLIFGDADALPIVSIVESPRPDFGTFAGNNEVRREQWAILIQGWTIDDVQHPADPLYGLMADVEAALAKINLMGSATDGMPSKPMYPEFFMLGGTIADFKIQPGVVRPRQEQPAAKACFLLPCTITFAGAPGGRPQAVTP